MNLKKLLSSLLVASMLVTSVFSNVGTSVFANEDEITTEVNNNSQQKVENEIGKNKENVPHKSGIIKGEDTSKESNTTSPEKTEKPASTTTSVTLEKVDGNEINVDLSNGKNTETLESPKISDDELVRVIIMLDDNAVLEDDNDAKLNFFTKLKISYLESKQNSLISKIENKVLNGEELDVHYQYTWVLNAIAAEVPYGLIDEIENIKGIENVLIQPVYELTTEKADPNTITDGVMIGRDDVWASGYTGEGMKIAIIDTGIDDDHQNFQAMDESKLTDDSLTIEDINNVLSQLHVSSIREGVTAEQLYRSNKIAFGFNYVDQNLTINHSAKDDYQGDHGTHVAGIAAANDLGDGGVVGTAPDAQLYVMKVFGVFGGAYPEDYFAAIEDALLLGADVVNLSLGSPAGFTTDVDYVNAIFEGIADTGTIVTISAGNSYTSGHGNLWGTDVNFASNPDNGIVGNPGTFTNVLTVGSNENVAITGPYVEVDGSKYGYIEGTGAQNALLSTLAGQEFEFVYVENYGQTAEDFTNAGDLTGKVALVQRGISSFVSKCELAAEAGAVAVLIYNNTIGTINMDLTDCTATIPCVSMTMEAGEYMVSKLAEGINTIKIGEGIASTPNPDAYKMSDFSSAGPTGDLTIGVDITGPGGNIYSTLDNGTYGLMSGTSMSAPNVAGLSALVKQYVETTFPEMDEKDVRTFVTTLLMSTAELLEYEEGLTYAPRQQGSGLANAYNAIKTLTYLSVDGMDAPKAELGDDVDRTGFYEYTFKVTNFGDFDAYYDVNTTIQTEEVLSIQGYKFMNGTPVALTGTTTNDSDSMVLALDYNEDGEIDVRDARYLYNLVLAGNVELSSSFRYDLNADEVVDTNDVQLYLDMLVDKDVDLAFDETEEVLKVAAGQTVEVAVTIQVSDDSKAYMDENFENGIYVEGFTVLSPLSTNTMELSLPYLAFYGDWTEAPILDEGYYYDEESLYDAYYYYNMLFTHYNGDPYSWYPGLNPYIDEEPNVDYISLSPNNDGFGDYITDAYVSLIRNAKELSFTYTDEEGNVLFEEIINYVSKSYYVDQYGICLPYVYSWYSEPYDLTDEEGNVLPNNSKVTLTIKAAIDYDKHEINNDSDTWEIPFTVDLEAPQILSYEFVEENDKKYLDLVISDNVATAAVNFISSNGLRVIAQEAVDHEAEANGTAIRYDITGFGNKFYVVLGDYAFNESYYYFKTTDNIPVLDDELLYGYRVFDTNEAYYQTDEEFGWISIDPEDASVEVHTSEWYMTYSLVAADYVGGYVVGVEAGSTDLVYMIPGDWDNRTKISTLGFEPRDLAFDPTTGYLYGYTVKDAEENAVYQLFRIDLSTGEYEFIGGTYGMYPAAFTLACDDNGQLYGIDSQGRLNLVDKEYGYWMDTILDTTETTGFRPRYAQSMTYSSDENSLYWAAYFTEDMYDENYKYLGTQYHGDLYSIDLETYEMKEIGTIAGDAEVVGLLMLDDRGYELPMDTPLQNVVIKEETVAMLVGEEKELTPVLTPWYGEYDSMTWESANESIVTVEDGVITAQGVGETTITLTVDGLTATCTVKVLDPQADLSGFIMSSDSYYNQWVDFNTDMEYEILTEMGSLTLYAGEYVNGTIYGFSSNGSFYAIDEETKEAKQIAGPRSDMVMYDMAYDYATGYLYGIMLDYNYYDYAFVAIDMATGTIEVLNYAIYDDQYNPPVALTVSQDGTIYMITMTGYLCTYDIENNTLNNLGHVGYTGSTMTQSMVYDYNGENAGIYWSMISSSYEMSIMYVDLETVTALPLGSFDGFMQICSLYMIPENIPALPHVDVEEVTLTSESVTLVEGGTATMPVTVLPFNATNRILDWTVADETIASINGMVVTGLKPGTTTATGTIDTVNGTEEVTVKITVLESAGELTGYILTDFATYDGYFWGEFKDSDLSSGEALGYVDYMLYAGEYYNGYSYGYGVDADYNSVFVKTNMTTLETELISGNYHDVRDMAFDYSEGVMYAVAGARNVTDGTTGLYAVDINTGDLYEIANLGVGMFTLACSTEGQLYGIDEIGTLYEINKIDGSLTAIGETYKYPNQYQSMTYDHNTGNLYWSYVYADYFGGGMETALYIVNKDDVNEDGEVSLINLGLIGTAGCQVTGLYVEPENVTAGTPEIRGLLLNTSNVVLELGSETYQLKATVFPISVNTPEVTYTYEVADENIATVDENGVISSVGAGSTTVTVTTNTGVNASATIHVVGDETKLNVMGANGWEISPLFAPETIDGSYANPANVTIEMATYSNGYFYGLDAEGYLWKYNQTEAEKVGTAPLYTTFDNANSYRIAESVVDLAFSLDGQKLYALGHMTMYSYYDYYFIYEVALDGETAGTCTKISMLDTSISRPEKFEFISENKMVIYDGFMDYIYTSDLDEDAYTLPYEQVLWVQNVVASGDYLGMTYSQELDLVFIATQNQALTDGGNIDLFKLDLNAKSITKVGTSAYSSEFRDIILIEE